MKQGRAARACQETAERLRKPESGTVTELDGPSQMGLAREMSSKGRRTSRKPVPAERPDGRLDVMTLEGIDSTEALNPV
jgi:hypothetical protein